MSIDHRNPPFKKGDSVKGYEIQRLIGSGGQGFVYEAIDDFLKLPVAIKAIPNTLDTSRNLRERARSEARLLARIRHPNVVQVTTADVTDDGVVCIVMDLLKGRSLRSMLRELNRVSVDEALLIGEQIAEGVQAAHEQMAIHRDLKPENVYIEPGNSVKVLDFGIAKITGLGAVTTQENLVQGTVQYMSPEHLQARPVTPRSDVFALGCILYELMSGSTPAAIGVSFDRCSRSQLEATGLKGLFSSGWLRSAVLVARRNHRVPAHVAYRGATSADMSSEFRASAQQAGHVVSTIRCGNVRSSRT